MNKRSLLCVTLYLLSLLIYGQQPDVLFGDDIFDTYGQAYDLNDGKNYLDAYRLIVTTEQKVDAVLCAAQLKSSSLSDNDFLYPYWAVKKSKAEIAYMVGNYTDMKAVSMELREALQAKQWSNTEGLSATIAGLQADLAKIDGSRYYLTQKYDSAEIALKRALQMGNFPGNEYFVSKVYGDLAQLYYKLEAYDMALVYLDSILAMPAYQGDSRLQETQQNVRLVRTQRALCLARLGDYDEALKEIEPACSYFKQLANKRLYAEALRKKAKILMLQYDSTNRYNSTAVDCYRAYLAISRNYIDNDFVRLSESEREQYWMAELPFVSDCFRLEDKAPGLLYDVALYSKAVLLQMGRDFKDGMTESERKRALASIRVTWQQVRDKLPTDGCAVEFVVYEKKNRNHIGALVITKKSQAPQFVDLGAVDSISGFSLRDQLSVKDVFADTQDRDKINALYNDTILPTLIWPERLVDAMGNSKNIYFSPDGILYQMGIEYMLPKTLKDRSFYRLTTTRLLVQPRQKLRTDRMLLCGGVEYGFSRADTVSGNDALAYTLLAAMNLNVTPLPNSAIEIDSIAAVRECHNGDLVLRADSLTEAALNQLMGKYHIVHLSTHGLFSEVASLGTDIQPSSTDMQLSKSCLFLSGSANTLNQNLFDVSQHDGILSARELAGMNLENVDLSVLSACMSGLGYITPDGVYGLQRGLKTAGVKTIISTLWSVDDEATCHFIVQLYKNLEAGMSLYEAFSTARTALMKYEKTYGNTSASGGEATGSFTQRRRITIPKFNKPYYYNAFILIDGLQ